MSWLKKTFKSIKHALRNPTHSKGISRIHRVASSGFGEYGVRKLNQLRRRSKLTGKYLKSSSSSSSNTQPVIYSSASQPVVNTRTLSSLTGGR